MTLEFMVYISNQYVNRIFNDGSFYAQIESMYLQYSRVYIVSSNHQHRLTRRVCRKPVGDKKNLFASIRVCS